MRHAASMSSAPSKIRTWRSACTAAGLPSRASVRVFHYSLQLTAGVGAQGDTREGDKCAADCVGACPQQGALDAASILTVPVCSLCSVCLSLQSVVPRLSIARSLSLSLALSRSIAGLSCPVSLLSLSLSRERALSLVSGSSLSRSLARSLSLSAELDTCSKQHGGHHAGFPDA